MSTPWLSLIGIGENGTDGLSATALRLIAEASLVVGGTRHLALAKDIIRGEQMAWPSPMGPAIADLLKTHRRHCEERSDAAIQEQRGGTPGLPRSQAAPRNDGDGPSLSPIVVLASGDPFWFGVGPLLTAGLNASEWRCLPHPSSLTLACARLGWAAQSITTISFCGRPLQPLSEQLFPGRQIIALSEDASTPATVAAFLTARGYGPSEIIVMEALEGKQERLRATTAANFNAPDPHPLNLLAITLRAEAGVQPPPLSAGLPDDLFQHDGQLTKQDIRAVTLSALAAHPGDLLWDIGAGAGSIGIEWLRQHPSLAAIAIEQHPERRARIAANAAHLAASRLHIVAGSAPAALAGLPAPNAIFIGGGATAPGMIDAAWSALRPGGRLVINAVTIETEAVVFACHARYGGTLSRLSVQRLTEIGTMHGFRPSMTVTQWVGCKP